MKHAKQTIAFLLLVCAFAACRPEKQEFSYLQEKSIANMAGQWKGVSVVQRDNDAERKKFPNQSMDITQFLKFTDFKLNLTASGDAATNFSIDNGTSLPLFRFTSGNWKVNNPNQVTEIKLINGTDTATLNLSPFSNLKEKRAVFSYSKMLAGKPVITYELTLTK